MPVGANQIIEADRLLWFRIIALTAAGINAGADGVQPIAVALQEAKQDPGVTLWLTPLAKPASSSRSEPNVSANTSQSSQAKRRRNRGRGTPPTSHTAEMATKRARFSQAMPGPLQGLSPTHEGQPVCYAYNLPQGCKLTVEDGKCSKGLHVCMKCHSKSHGAFSCKLADEDSRAKRTAEVHKESDALTACPPKSHLHLIPQIVEVCAGEAP
eukprot:6483081-Amphidinium_carterae.1